MENNKKIALGLLDFHRRTSKGTLTYADISICFLGGDLKSIIRIKKLKLRFPNDFITYAYIDDIYSPEKPDTNT